MCLVGRNLETLEAVSSSCAKKKSGNFSFYQIDLGIDEDIRLFARKLQKEFSAIDILVHSAGVISFGNVEESNIEDFDRDYQINVRAPYLLTQTLLPMLKIRCGQIVFINSSLGVSVKAGFGSYAAAKHALKGIADNLREEVNVDGLRILSVFLGRTATPMQELVHKMEGKAYRPEYLVQPEDIAAIVINALSLPRTVEVTDIYVRPLKQP